MENNKTIKYIQDHKEDLIIFYMAAQGIEEYNLTPDEVTHHVIIYLHNKIKNLQSIIDEVA